MVITDDLNDDDVDDDAAHLSTFSLSSLSLVCNLQILVYSITIFSGKGKNYMKSWCTSNDWYLNLYGSKPKIEDR